MHRTTLSRLLLSILAMLCAASVLAQTDSTQSPIEQQEPRAALPFPRPASKPIPLIVKLAIVLAVLAVSATALAFSVRAWQAGNLFDRQYRFPPVASVTPRLGANRSGGLMATISFRERGDPRDSGRENA